MKKNSPVAIDPIQEGVVKRHPDGFGFFIPDNSSIPDIYIPRKQMQSVMTNDRIKVTVIPEPGGERFRGKIEEIIQRNTKTAVGQIYRINDSISILRDESLAWGEDLRVTNIVEAHINDGDWVEVEVESYPGSDAGLSGKVIGHIGDSIDPQTDNKRAMAVHGVPSEFSMDAIKQAEKYPTEVVEEDKRGRRDLTEKPFITIDGKTAKDFDDAILVEKTEKGFKLYVAIADVSHYVKPQSPIDREAYMRGTSTYFPGFVAPMLPEALSNELCSLKPEVERLALVAEMQLDFTGELQGYEFFEAVIKSHARVIYGEAQEIIDGNEVEHLNHVKDNILIAKDLAKILLALRMKNGSLELNVPETIVELDETGQPVDIIKSERIFAHRMIEEMMLMANVAVAKYLDNREIPALYRIHEEPDNTSIEILKNYLSTLGIFMPRGGQLQKRLTNALMKFNGKPQSTIINILTLRSMSQAKYSPHNVGHFGLGFEHYAHFTSPIRRYPDLIIHRLIKTVVCPERGYEKYSTGELDTFGAVLSACEQRSVKAERFIDAIKKARFMNKHLGEEFVGIISSATKFGVFVQLRQFNVDGLVRIEELADEALMFDEEHLRLVGRKSGMSYNVGDEIKIVIAQCNIEQGQIDFTLAKGEKKRVRSEVNPEDRPKVTFAHPSKGKKKNKQKSKFRRDDFKKDGQGKKKSKNKSKKKTKSSNSGKRKPTRRSSDR